jgi:hypothetical protein
MMVMICLRKILGSVFFLLRSSHANSSFSKTFRKMSILEMRERRPEHYA